jgi:hypothetical protein
MDSKQSLLNLNAVLKHYSLPALTPLVAKDDRVFYRYTPEFERALLAKPISWKAWRLGISRHDDGDPTTRPIRGYRESVPFASCQIVIHGNPLPCVVEADIDLGNPGWGDLASAGLHVGEILLHKLSRLWGASGSTNPQRAAQWLRRRGIEV